MPAAALSLLPLGSTALLAPWSCPRVLSCRAATRQFPAMPALMVRETVNFRRVPCGSNRVFLTDSLQLSHNSGQYPGDGTTLIPLAGRGNDSAQPFITVSADGALRGVVIWHVEQVGRRIPVPYPFAVALVVGCGGRKVGARPPTCCARCINARPSHTFSCHDRATMPQSPMWKS